MRVAVLGAGSVGCWIGGAWAAAGLDVVFVGRERVRDEIAAAGLSVSDIGGWHVRLDPDRVDFQTAAATLRDAELIVLAVKGPATEGAARDIARHAGESAAILTFQNGIGSAERLRQLLPKSTVVAGTVAFNVVHRGAGRWHKATAGELIVARAPATEALAEAIGTRPGRLILSDDIAGALWGKLLLNLNNAVNALSGMTLLEQLRQRDYRKVVAAAMLETLELLDAAGIEPTKIGPIPPRLMPHAIAAPDLLFNQLFLRIQKIDAHARSSMADDLAAGRATEIDYLNGEVVALARRLGRPAPVNTTMVELVQQAEAGGRREWGPAELRERVLSQRTGAFGY